MEYQEYFSFAIAGELIFGNGCLKYLPEVLQKKLKVQNPLLVSDQGVAAAGHLDNIIKDIKSAGLSHGIFDDVEQEPSIENVMACVEKADAQGIESFVALGGGSVMDLAKAASVVLRYGGTVRDYLGQDNVPAMEEKVDNFSLKEAALKGIEAIRTLIKDVQLPATMREIGVKKEDIPEMAEIAMPILASLPGNPRAMTLEELIEVYERAY